MKKLKSIMFVGTGSDVGKSVLNAAFCRIFLQDGYSPAPFKAQNMSLNSYPTPDGLEIGRAQAVQAEACGIPPRVEMNPVLLKPTGDQHSQVVLNGKPQGNQSATEYFMESDRKALFAEVMRSYDRLAADHSPIVVEGAGSISEMNLWGKDITNMRVALADKIPTILIADIDRGGVFASVYGSIALIPEQERDLIIGVIINKFRGDISLFKSGREMLEKITGKPVLGVVPYFRDIQIEQEDSVVLDSKQKGPRAEGKVSIAVVLLRHMSNFTDFDVLERLPEVHLFYTANAEELLEADIVLIPGSKNTISDMFHLRKTGLAGAILHAHKLGKSVYGVCGGYQLMGQELLDPDHVEGNIAQIPGLGLLPVTTTMTNAKKTSQTNFTFLNSPETSKGYEIHMGETTITTNQPQPLCILQDGTPDGYFVNERTWGSYLHGIFDNPAVITYMLEQVGSKLESTVDQHTFKEEQYNKLADFVRANVNMDYIYSCITPNEKEK